MTIEQFEIPVDVPTIAPRTASARRSRVAAAVIILAGVTLAPLAATAQSARRLVSKTGNVAAPSDAEARSADHPTKTASDAQAKGNLDNWRKAQAAPAVPEVTREAIIAQPLTSENIRLLSELIDNPNALVVMESKKIQPERVFGTLWSALTVHQYIAAKREWDALAAAKDAGGTAEERSAAWRNAQKAFQEAFAEAGARNVTGSDLDAWARALTADRASYEKIKALIERGRPDDADRSSAQSKTPTAAIVPQVAVFDDPTPEVTKVAGPLPVNCNQPLAQGQYVKHYSSNWGLYISISWKCNWHWVQTGGWFGSGHWAYSWCSVNYKVADLTGGFDLTVNYKICCKGVTVSGTGSVTICGSAAGITKCANCTGVVTGLAGLSMSTSGSTCTYGFAVNAAITCKVGNWTVYSATWPYGWNITAPCIPAGIWPPC